MNNFTIIIPIYNESDSIFVLVKEIKKEFRGKLPEIIIVDDGSTDSFVSEKKKLTNNIKIISHHEWINENEILFFGKIEKYKSD